MYLYRWMNPPSLSLGENVKPTAVPTARNSSSACGKYTWQQHRAASLPVISTSCLVDADAGSTTRMHDAHEPGGALGAPNCSAGVMVTSSSSSSSPSTSILAAFVSPAAPSGPVRSS